MILKYERVTELAEKYTHEFGGTFHSRQIRGLLKGIVDAINEQDGKLSIQKAELAATTANSDYASALRVNEQYLQAVDKGYMGTFIMYTKERLHSITNVA